MHIRKSYAMILWSIRFFAVCAVSSATSTGDEQSLVEDEVERFIGGIQAGDINYSPQMTNDFVVHFQLYTPSNVSQGELLNATYQSVLSSSFDPAIKTKVIIHGYRPLVAKIPKWVSKMVRQILTFDTANVITVEWLQGVRTDYDHARRNTRRAGTQVADLLSEIFNAFDGYDPSKVHVIGFSLGAHVAGFTAKEIKARNATKIIGRVTGLDPAGPGFFLNSPDYRLDWRDADFVDVIHTDATAQYELELGINGNIGHADFYPNGGSSQAGCKRFGDVKLADNILKDMVRIVSCDHTRAVDFYIHSMNDSYRNSFKAFRCLNYERFKRGRCFACSNGSRRCTTMGYWLRREDVKRPGSYFLQTDVTPPYCVRHYRVDIHWGQRKKTSKGMQSIVYDFRQLATRGKVSRNGWMILHGSESQTKALNLGDGMPISITPNTKSQYLLVNPCDSNVGNIQRVTINLRKTEDWLSTIVDTTESTLIINKVLIFDTETQKRFVSRGRHQQSADGEQQFEIDMDE